MTECINYDGAGKIWLRTVDLYGNDVEVAGICFSLPMTGDGEVMKSRFAVWQEVISVETISN